LTNSVLGYFLNVKTLAKFLQELTAI
jgi:hypothetical protein